MYTMVVYVVYSSTVNIEYTSYFDPMYITDYTLYHGNCRGEEKWEENDELDWNGM